MIKLILNPDKIHTLERDGIELCCPFKTGAGAQTAQGGVMFINQKCDSTCSLFRATLIPPVLKSMEQEPEYKVELCECDYEFVPITERVLHSAPTIVR